MQQIRGKLANRHYAVGGLVVLALAGGAFAGRGIFSAGAPVGPDAPNATATRTPAPVTVRGHLLLPGRPSPPNARWIVAVSGALSRQDGAGYLNYSATTDQSGYFTVTTSLPAGSYAWLVKNPVGLANAGGASLVSGANVVEMGTLTVGDANDDNCVGAVDFNIIRGGFGKSAGEPGYDGRGDFNGDGGVNASDFNLQRNSFGQCGAAPIASPTPVSTRTATAVASPTASGGCTIFPANNVWNRNIAALPTHAMSSQYIASIGTSAQLHADFGSGLWNGGPIGIPYTTVTVLQPRVPVTFLYESDPGPYPIPTNAPIEEGPNSTGDRHVIVLERDSCTLYEMYSSYPHADGSWNAGSGALWQLSSNLLRPAGWTSADAAGLPILPGLARYDELASGTIRHALRFTSDQTQRAYIWPARHYSGSDTNPNLPPMGLRVRLKASVNIAGFPTQARVVLQAMKDYGLILADNGTSWHVTGAPDERWDNDVLHQLETLHGSDFEAVDESGLMIDPNSGQSR